MGMTRLGPGGMLRLGTVLCGGLALVVSCAMPSRPSGGPRAWIPPMVVSTWPDTFEVIEPTRKPVVIRYSTRLSERPTEGTLDNAVLVSPATSGHRVKLTRNGLEISVTGGLRPDLVYRVRVLPTIKDLFGNAMEGPFELVFSTGGEFEANVIAGLATDRVSGDPLPNVRVEARDAEIDEDGAAYVAFTDTAGVYVLRYVPSGSYRVTLFEDINRNARPDFRELQAETEAEVGLEPSRPDTVIQEVSLLRPDTTPARLIRVQAEDSLLLRLTFDDYLDPTMEGVLADVHVTLTPEERKEEQEEEEEEEEEQEEERATPRVVALLWEHQVDSMKARADSMRAEAARLALADSLTRAADSLRTVLPFFRAAGDTVQIDSIEVRLESIAARLAPPEPPRRPAAEPEPPGRGGGGGEVAVSWTPPDPPREARPPPADTAAVPPPDTTVVPPPDTTIVPPPDTTIVPPPDTTSVPPPDTTVVPPPDTTAVPPPDTTIVPPPDTTVVPPPDTTIVPPPDTTAVPPGADRAAPLWWLSRRSP